MEINKKITQRGFRVNSFTDLYGAECSIQESSLATDSAIWFGVDKDLEGEWVNNRMHLNRKMVLKLLPTLIWFVLLGSLPTKVKRSGGE